jgi:hypothetical protein
MAAASPNITVAIDFFMRISGVCISIFILGQKTASDETGAFQSLHGASGCGKFTLRHTCLSQTLYHGHGHDHDTIYNSFMNRQDSYHSNKGLGITKAPARLGVSRLTLSRLINGHQGVSPDMALPPEKAGAGTAHSGCSCK